MKRYILIGLLLLGGCGEPAESSPQGRSPTITTPPEASEEPEELDSETSELMDQAVALGALQEAWDTGLTFKFKSTICELYKVDRVMVLRTYERQFKQDGINVTRNQLDLFLANNCEDF